MEVLHQAGLVRVRRCRGAVLAYLATDAHVGRALDTYGEWAVAELELLSALLPAGGVAVDVGANLGTHAVAFAQKVGPAGTVVALEPQRLVHQLLCANAALNGLTWLRALHAAAGAAPGTLKVPHIDYAAGGNFGGLALGAWTEGEAVPVLALDGLGLRRCDLLKVDVEGMEGEVLDGGRELLTRCRPVLYLEHNRPEGEPRVVERLLGHGYSCFWHFSPFFRPDNFAGVTTDCFGGLVDANLVAVPPALAPALKSLEPLAGPADTAAAALARRRAHRGG